MLVHIPLNLPANVLMQLSDARLYDELLRQACTHHVGFSIHPARLRNDLVLVPLDLPAQLLTGCGSGVADCDYSAAHHVCVLDPRSHNCRTCQENAAF